MSLLDRIFSSRIRAEIFRHLFGLTGESLHVRELTRRSGLNSATVRQDLRKLESMDLVRSRRDGNRLYYGRTPIIQSIRHPRNRAQDGRAGRPSEAAPGWAGVRVAFVFGSVAEGTPGAASDVDLCVVGPSVSARCRRASQALRWRSAGR